jgi:DNA-binding NarL/FixJ family response regulator
VVEEPMAQSTSNKSVLLVDADEISRQAIAHLVAYKLPELNLHIVDCLTSGIEYCAHNKTDIIIIDLTNKSNLSFDLVKQIRLTNTHIRLILVTNHSETSDPYNLNMISNCSIARKPLDIHELLALLNKTAFVIEE